DRGESDARREHLVAGEPGIPRPHLGDALDHKPRRDEQPTRECDLADDQRLADPADPEGRRAARLVLQHLVDVGARRLAGGGRAATRIVNNSTCGGRRVSMKKGMDCAAIARLNVSTPKYASTIPSPVAAIDNTNASARNCRTTAERDAPNAVRMPTSLVRCAA